MQDGQWLSVTKNKRLIGNSLRSYIHIYVYLLHRVRVSNVPCNTPFNHHIVRCSFINSWIFHSVIYLCIGRIIYNTMLTSRLYPLANYILFVPDQNDRRLSYTMYKQYRHFQNRILGLGIFICYEKILIIIIITIMLFNEIVLCYWTYSKTNLTSVKFV